MKRENMSARAEAYPLNTRVFALLFREKEYNGVAIELSRWFKYKPSRISFYLCYYRLTWPKGVSIDLFTHCQSRPWPGLPSFILYPFNQGFSFADFDLSFAASCWYRKPPQEQILGLVLLIGPNWMVPNQWSDGSTSRILPYFFIFRHFWNGIENPISRPNLTYPKMLWKPQKM